MKQTQTANGCGIGCLAILMIVVITSFFSSNKDSSSSGSRPSIGESGVLRVSNGGDVLVAISEEALDRLTQLSVAKDGAGVGKMILDGSAWTVPSGTKCHVIDPGVFTYEVRISEGVHADEACFVASDFVKRR